MKKVLVSCLLLSLWLSLDGSSVWAVDVGWMQQGVRVWYFGSTGSVSSSEAEEAYLFTSISGNTAQLAHNTGVSHWSQFLSTETVTGSIIDQGPFWIHPQVLQNIKVGDKWQGIDIATMNRATYTYDTFKNNAEFASIPYLLLPIKTLFDLKPQREIVKLVYGIPYWPGYPVWGTAFFDAETGLCLFNLKLTVSNTTWFILSEINYNFANQTAFAEDNGPHTGFGSNIVKTTNTSQYVMIQSSVETRYGDTVQMWVSTSAGGSINIYAPPNENYCFFGSVPVLRHKYMTVTPNYPPENWNEYGQYLWWWVPTEVLQNSTINVFGITLTRTSTNPYTFTAQGTPAGFYFSTIIFDSDGYMADLSVKDTAVGLNIGLGPSANPNLPIHLVNGLFYYKNTMGRAVPVEIIYRLTMTVKSDTADKGGGSVHGDGNIACDGHGSGTSGMSGNCQADFSSGTSVNLTQSHDSDSTWATWSVPGCGTNLSCAVLMNGVKNVTVTFPYSPMAKVNSTSYRCDSLALAYGNAATVDIIYGRAVTFPENFTLSGGKAVTLLGGRDPWYQTQDAWTTLQGILAIQGGSLSVERLVIK